MVFSLQLYLLMQGARSSVDYSVVIFLHSLTCVVQWDWLLWFIKVSWSYNTKYLKHSSMFACQSDPIYIMTLKSHENLANINSSWIIQGGTPISLHHHHHDVIKSLCVNSVPLYVRKLRFMYELVLTSSKYRWSIYRTSGKYRWSIYRTSGKCCWSIYRTSRKRCGTLRVVHKSGTEFTHSANGNIFHVTGPLWGEFTGHQWIPLTKPVTQRFDVFFDLCLNKRLSKQSRRQWFETPSRSLWRQCNDDGCPGAIVLTALWLISVICHHIKCTALHPLSKSILKKGQKAGKWLVSLLLISSPYEFLYLEIRKYCLSTYRIYIIKMKLFNDCLIFIMGILYLERQSLYRNGPQVTWI